MLRVSMRSLVASATVLPRVISGHPLLPRRRNHLLQERSLEAEEARLLDSLRRSAVPVVVVSNEVGQGIVPEHALGRQFREAQGRLNIALAKQAETVVQVVAGLPRALKGELP